MKAEGSGSCPGCGSEDWDDNCRECGECSYSELRCPFCGEVVHIIGGDDCPFPCSCVVAQDYGDGIIWEAAAFKRKLHELARHARNGEDEVGEDLSEFRPDVSEVEGLCEGDPDIAVASHDDGGPHGHCFRAWFVFARCQPA